MALADVLSKAMVLLLLTFCLLFLLLWESVIVLCFVVRYFMSILVLQSSWWGRESWLLCLICLPGVFWWLSGSSSPGHWVVCGLGLWYFLIILTYYFRRWFCCCCLFIYCYSHCGSLLLCYILLYVTLCPLLYCNHLDGEERAVCFAKFFFLCLAWWLRGSSSRCHGLVWGLWL